jgi:adenosylmethionine-8-amino-7-oxononanoate aminotransferase
VIGTGGVIAPAPGYLDGLQRLARRHEFLLVADEVITGFGRTGTMFACERFGLGAALADHEREEQPA